MLPVSLKMLDHNISCHVGEQVEAFSDLFFWTNVFVMTSLSVCQRRRNLRFLPFLPKNSQNCGQRGLSVLGNGFWSEDHSLLLFWPQLPSNKLSTTLLTKYPWTSLLWSQNNILLVFSNVVDILLLKTLILLGSYLHGWVDDRDLVSPKVFVTWCLFWVSHQLLLFKNLIYNACKMLQVHDKKYMPLAGAVDV